MVVFPLPCQRHEGILLWYLLNIRDKSDRKLAELLEVKLTKLWGALYDWVPLECYLTLRLVHTEISAICTLQYRFCIRPSFSHWFLLVSLCYSKLWLPIFFCLLLQSWGLQLTLRSHFSYRFKKNCWFFSLFSFLRVITECWLLSFLRAVLETGTLNHLLLN